MQAAVVYSATARDQESLLDYLGEPESVTLRLPGSGSLEYGNSARFRDLAGIGASSPSAVLVMRLSCTSITLSVKVRPLKFA